MIPYDDEMARHLRHVVDGLVNETGGRVERSEIQEAVDDAFEELAEEARLAQYLPILTARQARLLLNTRQHERGERPSDFTRVLIACPTNSGRSQSAAALLRFYVPGHVEVISAGDQAAGEVKPVVIEYLREHGVELTDYPKRIRPEFIRTADHIVMLGHPNVEIPPDKDLEVWAGPRMSTLDDQESRSAIRDIDAQVLALIRRILPDVEPPTSVFARPGQTVGGSASPFEA